MTSKDEMYEADARTRKALALSDRFDAEFPGRDPRTLTRDEWRHLARVAGVNPPSDVTVAAAAVLVEHRQEVVANLPQNPLDGLPC